MGAGSLVRPTRAKLARKRQQVAAVCYRIRGNSLEFLLVQTRGGRWIFPKGGVEPGLTHAQSAALEAFEEAGVHGRIELIPFARYFRRKPDSTSTKPGMLPRYPEPDFPVTAHLCEVSRLERPQEPNRHPSWFSPDKAKQRLLKDRAPEFAAELIRVVDKAAARIHRLHSAARAPVRPPIDGLQKVRFEAHEDGRLYDTLRQAARARYLLAAPQLRLTAGETIANAPRNVTPIDRQSRQSTTRRGREDKLCPKELKPRHQPRTTSQ